MFPLEAQLPGAVQLVLEMFCMLWMALLFAILIRFDCKT
jgi:hypothetical protein